MSLGMLAWRSLLARPLRTSLTVVGVALGVAIIAGTLTTGRASDQALRSSISELLGAAELRVRAFDDAGFTPRALQALRDIGGVVRAAPVAERRLTVGAEPDRVFQLLVVGVDMPVEQAIRNPNLAFGTPLSTSDPTGALVPAAWAADEGVEFGERLFLSGDLAEAPPLQVVGLIQGIGFGALNGGRVLIMSRATLDAAYDIPAPVRYIDLDIAEGRVEDVTAAIGARLNEPFVLETAADAGSRLAGAQNAFADVAFLFGLIALLVGAFGVGNTMAMTVRERMRELGLLRAAGATARQVRGLILRQAAAIGLVGALAGVLLGSAVAFAMIGILDSTRSVLVEGPPLDPLALALAGGLGLLVTLGAAVIPAVRAGSLPPIEALRPSPISVRGLGDRLRWIIVVELGVVGAGLVLLSTGGTEPLAAGTEDATSILRVLLALALLLAGAVAAAFLLEPLGSLVGRPFEWFFGAQGLLGRANLGRDRVRTGLTVGALMIGLAAIVALGAVAESTRASARAWVGSILPGGHAIRLGTPVDVEQFRPTFDGTPGLRVASPILELPVVISEADGAREAGLAGIDPNVFADTGSLRLTDGDRTAAFAALRSGGAVLVPDGVARRSGIEVGDAIEIGRPGEDAVLFAVAGVVDFSLPTRTPDGALLISSADARDVFGATAASLWAMVPRPEIAPSAFRAAVRGTAASLAGEALTAAELADELSRGLDRLLGLFDALALVAVVIGALGIVNALSIGVSERVREIAILRANGMTVGQVQAMVVTEGAIIGAIGGVLAIATGLAVAWALVGSAGLPALDAGLELPWPLLLAVVLLGTGVAALAGIYPARVAGSLPIVRQFKQFE